MDLTMTPTGESMLAKANRFIDEHVYDAEPGYAEALRTEPHVLPQIVEELKARARAEGLWNLFLPDVSGLSNLDYAHIAEVTGRSPYLAPEIFNCSAPDTGNMELLHMFGTDDQKQRWLAPTMSGDMRSGFSMTEPDVASSDARNISTSITLDGDEVVINGRKWWTTGAADPRCGYFVVMGKSDPEASAYKQQSMVIVPRDAPGVHIVRSLPLYGYQDQHGHGEIVYDNVRLPRAAVLGELGEGFAMAQARLGPGRVHHAMRCIGMAERALDLMVDRASRREAFGKSLIDQGVVQQWIAESRLEIEQARLLVLKCAWLIDQLGVSAARTEVAAIKVVAPRVARSVIDRAIQTHGGGGVTDDFPLARMWVTGRILAIADGPDEVHLRSVARVERSRVAAEAASGRVR
jgi:acyl-CoA dehydrogenase